ncbi:hypothetical protein EX30DRAFT_343189 [Ascodesmis nigricans]|uniref:Uncharacterized protein n=1 Tax=Ascodesmis nigricans TaxID=341454 RepID=A0A4S2MRF9_9PEZI|nr:hypothetical protein EX30DRAFT_343189 [Ascodesmis nigricans]
MSLLLLLLFVDSASAANRTLNYTRVGWVPEPDGRGTLSIILLCGISLGLCIWTALHLNIEPASLKLGLKPPPGYMGKIVWAFVALIAPELVSTVALHQFLVVRRFCSKANHNVPRKERITMSKAFFAIMGGLAVVRAHPWSDGERFNPVDVSPLRLLRHNHRRRQESKGWYYRSQAAPLQYLERDELVPVPIDALATEEWRQNLQRISDHEIDVRSKADGLAKVIVCSQAIWVFLQCITRSIDYLPITPLELTTILHIVNLIFMYAAWWKKPVDAGRSMILVTKPNIKDAFHWDILERDFVQFLETEHKKDHVMHPYVSLSDWMMYRRERRWRGDTLSHFLDLAAVVFDPDGNDSEGEEARYYSEYNVQDENLLRKLNYLNTLAHSALNTSKGHVRLDGALITDKNHQRTTLEIISRILNVLDKIYDGIIPDECLRELRSGRRSEDITRSSLDPTSRTEPLAMSGEATPPDKFDSVNVDSIVTISGERTAPNDSSSMDIRVDIPSINSGDDTPQVNSKSELRREKENRQRLRWKQAVFEYRAEINPLSTIEFKLEESFQSVSNDGELKTIHTNSLLEVIKLLDRFTASLLPKDRSTWWGRKKQLLVDTWSIITYTFSQSLIRNQFIHIPGLFSHNPFFERFEISEPERTDEESAKETQEGVVVAPHEYIWTYFDTRWQFRHRVYLVLYAGTAGCLYGGLHAIKWNQEFPTAIEQRMWQISCIMGLMGILPVIAFGATGFASLWFKSYRGQKMFQVFCIVSGVIMAVCFLFARCFLMIESWLSLRSLPQSAYLTVKWLDFWKGGISIGQQ